MRQIGIVGCLRTAFCSRQPPKLGCPGAPTGRTRRLREIYQHYQKQAVRSQLLRVRALLEQGTNIEPPFGAAGICRPHSATAMRDELYRALRCSVPNSIPLRASANAAMRTTLLPA